MQGAEAAGGGVGWLIRGRRHVWVSFEYWVAHGARRKLDTGDGRPRR
jgi:hypothetical protein